MRKIVLLALLAMSASVFANSNYVHWAGGTGDWMTSANWQNEDPAPDWNIPGWVVGNPWNTGGSTALDWNYGRAIIESGTAQITPSSAPDGKVSKLYLGGTGGANVEISSDAQFKDIYLADKGESATVTQTAGDVVLSGNYTTHIGRSGEGTYNLSGGTLTHNSTAGADTHTFIGVYNGADGTFNQTGGTFTKNGTVQQNINVGYYTGAKGTVNLDGGQFMVEVGDEMALGYYSGSEGYLNIGDNALLRIGDGNIPTNGEPATGWGTLVAGKYGYGKISQTGGAIEANYLKLGEKSTGYGEYVISGGSLDLATYIYLAYAGTFTISGSGADHIRMNRFVPNYNAIGIELDANGSTLIEVNGVASNRYHDARANARWVINTLPGFNGQVGDTYDVLYSPNLPLTDTSYLNINNVGWALFEREIVATNSGEMLRFKMVGTKANAVVWSGTGNWMDSSHWTDVAPAPDWTIPGLGPLNEGEALIRSGEVNITAASSPDAPVVRTDIGGVAGATINITGGNVEFKDIYMSEQGQTSTINQTAGNVVFSGNNVTHIGRQGHGIYNLSGGTLMHTSDPDADTHDFIGVYEGARGELNVSGNGVFTKNGTVQQNILLGYANGSKGTVNLSGDGQFLYDVGDEMQLGASYAAAAGYLNISDNAVLRVGDGIGAGSAQPSTGWGALVVGRYGYGELNQTGGSVIANYIKLATYDSGVGKYTISGGSVLATRYLYLVKTNSTLTVVGSTADSILMKRFIALGGTTLNLQLDENGTTLIEADGASDDSYRDAVLRGTVSVDTLDSFNAPSGTVFDVVWSANNIETTSMTFTNLSDRATFDWQVVTKDNNGVPGQMLQLVTTSAKTPLDLWAEGYGLTGTDAEAMADPDVDGFNNLYEFGLGGDPTDPLDQGIAPTYAMVEDGGTTWMTYVYPKRSAYSGLNYYLELTDDLVIGGWADSGYEEQGTGTINDDFDAVTNRVSTAVEGEQFIRLIIEE